MAATDLTFGKSDPITAGLDVSYIDDVCSIEELGTDEKVGEPRLSVEHSLDAGRCGALT